MRKAFPLLLLFVFTALSSNAQGWTAADSAAVRSIAQWTRENDPLTDLKYLRKTANAWIATRVLQSGDQPNGEINAWREHYFNLSGAWMESRTYLNTTSCEELSQLHCDALNLLKENYRTRYGTVLNGTLLLTEMPKYSWIEAPLSNGVVLYDLFGNFIEERTTDK